MLSEDLVDIIRLLAICLDSSNTTEEIVIAKKAIIEIIENRTNNHS